jgi:RsiW-degrading membrane proteinase PrsW (M82 family)
MTAFFLSAFSFPGLSGVLVLLAVAIGLVFGAVWLVPYWTPIFKRGSLWLVALSSAILTWASISYVQILLQGLTGAALLAFWDQTTLTAWLLLAGIPQILLSGLVQEAAKLVPVIIYRTRTKLRFTPRCGLMVGAVSGVGFGVFEAIWVHNTLFAGGWNWSAVEMSGFSALLGFVERFFAVGMHTGVCALAGYGLARKLGWQFYLIASFLHALTNYSIVLLQRGLFTPVEMEIYVAVLALAATTAALWLRWRGVADVPAEESLGSA